MSYFLKIPRAYLNYLASPISKSGGLARIGPLQLDSAKRIVNIQFGLCLVNVFLAGISGAGENRLWIYFAVSAVGILTPLKVVFGAEKKRQRMVLGELPGLMEIIAMVMETGLSFDAAVKYIADHKRGYVADLFKRARNEIDAGTRRETAYSRIAKKGSNELAVFLDLVINAEAQGRPVKNLILNLSQSFRERQKNAIEEEANCLPTTMLIPIFTCIVPPMIVIYLLPALQNMGALFR